MCVLTVHVRFRLRFFFVHSALVQTKKSLIFLVMMRSFAIHWRKIARIPWRKHCSKFTSVFVQVKLGASANSAGGSARRILLLGNAGSETLNKVLGKPGRALTRIEDQRLPSDGNRFDLIVLVDDVDDRAHDVERFGEITAQTLVLTHPDDPIHPLASGELLALACSSAPRHALARYRARWRIETMFGNLKSKGFALEYALHTIKSNGDQIPDAIVVIDMSHCGEARYNTEADLAAGLADERRPGDGRLHLRDDRAERPERAAVDRPR